jgi:hypothetical protein
VTTKDLTGFGRAELIARIEALRADRADLRKALRRLLNASTAGTVKAQFAAQRKASEALERTEES